MQRGDFLEGSKSKSEYRKDARRHWPWIRLLVSDISVSYEEARNMHPDEVYMLNEALDMVEEKRKSQQKKK